MVEQNSEKGKPAGDPTTTILENVGRSMPAFRKLPADVQTDLLTAVAGIVRPYEARYHGSWRRNQDQISRELGQIAKFMQDPSIQLGLPPEAEQLRDIAGQLMGRTRMKVDTAHLLVSNIFDQTITLFRNGFTTMAEQRGFENAFRGSRVSVGREGHSRGLGLDVNPPNSSSQFRKS